VFLPIFSDSRVERLEQRVAELEERERTRDAQFRRVTGELAQLATLLAERARTPAAAQVQDNA